MHENNIAIQIDGIPTHIKPMGYCIASNKITVDGEKVGFMYREELVDIEDSGWRFMVGTETEEYLEDPANGKIFDVNIIANHDKAIIPFLSMKIGSELERVGDSFVVLED
ncbi:MAG: DUF2185 domain-containing protein [Bacteroidota bacterium]|jgi:hypothetical protein